MPRTRLYFSFRSPFSWLMIERLRGLCPSMLQELELIPYWEPDVRTAAELAQIGAAIQYSAMSKAKHLYILQDVKRLATALKLTIRWPVDVDPWWEPAHLGWLAARRHERAHEFYAAVVDARWLRAENISDLSVIAAAAHEAGLEPDAITGAVDDPETRAEGVGCLKGAYEDDIFGVPYLMLGWRRYWGYDRLDHFLADAGVELEPCGVAPGAAADLGAFPEPVLHGRHPYDNDTAGGCG
jgi:2-hydroxychromene-2-carboxylate isomerase